MKVHDLAVDVAGNCSLWLCLWEFVGEKRGVELEDAAADDSAAGPGLGPHGGGGRERLHPLLSVHGYVSIAGSELHGGPGKTVERWAIIGTKDAQFAGSGRWYKYNRIQSQCEECECNTV